MATGGDTAILADTYLLLGAIWDVRGDADSAIHYNQVALPMFLKNSNYISVGRVYANIGAAYHRKMEHIKALEYYEKAQ